MHVSNKDEPLKIESEYRNLRLPVFIRAVHGAGWVQENFPVALHKLSTGKNGSIRYRTEVVCCDKLEV